MEKLICKNLSAKVGEKVLLNDINFSIEEGKTMMLIGQSGSGKSLISKMLLGSRSSAIKVSGELIYEGVNLLSLDVKQWNKYRGKKIAYITQNPMAVFNPMQTVFSHAHELFKSHLGYEKEQTGKTMLEAMEKFRLKNPEKLIDMYPFQLSGGMLQRIMLSMVLSLSPGLLIADEPTSALDEGNRQIVAELLQEVKKRGVSMLVVTHDYKLATALADDVFIIKNGDMVEYGDAEKVLKNPDTEYAKKLLKPRKFEG